jgi:SagB-type dehydrogenase family enzyme
MAVLLFLGVLPSSASQAGEDVPALGERFHRETSITWSGVPADKGLARPSAPPQFKSYPDAAVVELPEASHSGLTVEEALRERRSRRDYSGESITLTELSQLLFAAQGNTGTLGDRILRTAPSAGALYPFEVYVVVNQVDELAPGLYHYSVRNHSLETLKQEDLEDDIHDAALNQGPFQDFAAAFILTAVFDRTLSKYGQRGYRYIYIEAGHISQNISLQATSLGLGSVCVGAFLDQEVNELLGIDGNEEAVIYLHACGRL